jgi:hypothetical protein
MNQIWRIFPLLLLAIFLPGVAEAAEDEGASLLRATFIRCAAIFAVTGVEAQGSERGDAYASAGMLFAHWASSASESTGVTRSEASASTSRDLADQIQSLSKDVKDRSSPQATAREIVAATAQESKRCADLFRKESAVRSDK